MSNIISLPVNYYGNEFSSLVRIIKKDDNVIQLRVTIMNGNLEMLLFGHNVFDCVDGAIISYNKPVNKEALYLQQQVIRSLEKHVKEYPVYLTAGSGIL
jgi:hypothetical protein